MVYSWTGKAINEMSSYELKDCLSFTENRLAYYRKLKSLGYDRYEINPKIKSLVERKKSLKAQIKELKSINK